MLASTPRNGDLQAGKGDQPQSSPSRDHAQVLADLRAEKLSLINDFPSSPDQDSSESNQDLEARVMREAKAAIQAHAARLGKYNEVKDTCQNLLGLLAESRGVRVVDIMKELGIDEET